jgi:hypothetical protein
MQGYTIFMNELRSLEHRQARLSSNRISIQADMLKERCKGLSIDFRDLMQADFVIFLRSKLTGVWWYADTFIFMVHNLRGPLEIFARAKSKRYFNRIAPMLGVSDVESFRSEIKSLAANPRNLPRADYHTMPVERATGIDEIGTTA